MQTRTTALLLLSLALAVSPVYAQQKFTAQDAAATIHRMHPDREEYTRWHSECDAAQCTLSADFLRGDSGDPADRTDHDQYITITMSLPLKSTKPDSLVIHLPPWAQKDQGLFLAFTAKPAANAADPPQLDADGTIPLAITSCDDESCVIDAPKGTVAASEHSIDLLDKFLHSDHLILLFISDNSPYRTSIALESFREAWSRLQKTP